MSETTDQAFSRLEVLAHGPAELRKIGKQAVEAFVKKTMERLSANEETAGIAAKVGGTLTILAATFTEALVTEKVVMVEKARAETIKSLHEANKAEAEAEKAVADKEVSQATAEKIRTESLLNKLNAIKIAVEMIEKHANPLVDELVKDALFDAGDEDSRAAFSLGIQARDLAKPAGDAAGLASGDAAEA